MTLALEAPLMPRVLRRIESIVPRRAADYGGKARGLAALARAGFPVPAAYAMPGWVGESFLSSVLPIEDRPRALLNEPFVEPARLADIAGRVKDATLPQDVTTAVAEALRALRKEGATGFVVRSSAVHEDQQNASAAGMHVTRINLTTDREVLDAVRSAWAGVFRERTLAYLRSLPEDVPIGVGVVIQAVVASDLSGVMFTINPLTGDANEVVINASYGLGDLVCDGRVSPDTYRLEKPAGDVRDRVLGGKENRTVLDGAGGVRQEPVPRELREAFCLEEDHLFELAAVADRLEGHFGAPRDVEWAFSDGHLYLLQARPISAARRRVRRSARKEPTVPRSRLVWSNINVGEALPGVATPLTWSVLSRFSEIGFRRAFGALGCSVPKDAELVGDFRGRIYLNLTEFCSILSQIPWIHPSTLVRLGGAQYAAELDEVVTERSSTRFFLRLPQTVTRYVRENFKLQQRLDEFEAYFAEEQARFREVDVRILSPAGLDRMLMDAEHLLDDTGSIMLTVYANLLTAVLFLVGTVRTFASDEHGVRISDLLSGLANLDSAEPGFDLLEIAGITKADGPARQLILETPLDELSVDALPEGPTRGAIEAFVDKHGHRGVREAEIAEPRWREEPTLMFATIRSHLQTETDPRQRRRDQARRRDRAEEQLRQAVPIALRPLLDRLLEVVRRFTQMREHLRSYVVEVLGVYRSIALEASRRIATREPEAGDDAAFYLTADELRVVLRGERQPVAMLVHRRRVQHNRNVALPDPPPTFVGFPPLDAPAQSSDGELRGLAASGGVAEGLVRIVRKPSEAGQFKAGEVLVVPAADTGWSPLFLAAAGVVTELGGPLSHAAIILREYAVPAVVNVPQATQALRDGDRVRVDGDSGMVKLLDA